MTSEGYSLDRDEHGLTRQERIVAALMRIGRKRNRIAEDIGVSRQRVSQLVNSVKAKGASVELADDKIPSYRLLREYGVPFDDPETRRLEAREADEAAGIREDPL